ncbi:MAG: hypothetical protein L6W00_08045 [Lentisphaeria bacterium]|nr:MAG: hypothetical protein L6W00_08045 [Lentisphaeria bacterium]
MPSSTAMIRATCSLVAPPLPTAERLADRGGVGVDGDLFFRESGQDRAARHAEDDRGRGVFPQKRFLD